MQVGAIGCRRFLPIDCARFFPIHVRLRPDPPPLRATLNTVLVVGRRIRALAFSSFPALRKGFALIGMVRRARDRAPRPQGKKQRAAKTSSSRPLHAWF